MKRENPYKPVWRERWRPEGCHIKGLLKCGKVCPVENMGACAAPPLPNSLPEPNEGVTEIRSLRYGSHSYEEEWMEYGKAITAWHEDEDEPRPHWSDFCRDPYALVFVWEYVNLDDWKNRVTRAHGLTTDLWDPELLQQMLLKDGGVITAIHEAARLQFPEFTINGIARQIRRVFVTDFQIKQRAIRFAKIKACQEADNNPLLKEWADAQPGWDFHWKLCLDSIERCMTLIARCLIAHYSDPDNEAEWAMLIASYTPEDPDLQQRLEKIQQEHDRWKGHAFRIPKKDRRPPDVIAAEQRAAAERAAAASLAAGVASPLVKRVKKQRTDPNPPAQ